MSRVYFTTLGGEAALRGSERAWGGCLVNDIGMQQLIARAGRLSEVSLSTLVAALRPQPSHVHDERSLGWHLRAGGAGHIETPDGKLHDLLAVALNTTVMLGSPAVQLLAWLHGQCEVHGWVDGPDRAWLATVIAQGLTVGVLRDGQGWETVVLLLLASDAEPVACSYSVCEGFPNRNTADWETPDPDDGEVTDWDDLTKEERWRLGVAYLRKNDGLQLRPDNLAVPRFGSGATAFDVLDALGR